MVTEDGSTLEPGRCLLRISAQSLEVMRVGNADQPYETHKALNPSLIPAVPAPLNSPVLEANY